MKPLRVLVACEFSGIVREALARHGHDAWSCDLIPSEKPGKHIQDDVFRHLEDGWDMMIFFWPCTNMAVSGARWFKDKKELQDRDIAAFIALMNCNIPKIAGENPIGVLSTRYRKPDQIIQPWMFGHPETKATCLWLKNLPKLQPTNIVNQREERIHKLSALRGCGSSKTRQQDRSRTFPGIAEAMASQWSVE